MTGNKPGERFALTLLAVHYQLPAILSGLLRMEPLRPSKIIRLKV